MRGEGGVERKGERVCGCACVNISHVFAADGGVS